MNSFTRFLVLAFLSLLAGTAWAQTITSFSPTSGEAGTSVTITGTGLSNTRSVLLRGISANLTSVSATQVSFRVPAQASTGKLRLTTTGGTVLSGSDFTVTRASSSLTYVLRSTSFNSISVGNAATPAFTDLDHDGRLDMLVGQQNGEVSHYEQSAANSTTFTLVSTNLSGLAGHYNSLVSVTDIDGDGLLELVVGTGGGNFKHYEQSAANSTSFTLLANDFNNVFSTGGLTFQIPHFTDIDNDGLLDLLVGDEFLSRYEQTAANGGTFTRLNNQDFGPTADARNGGAASCVVDLDGDGRLDMLVGSSGNQLAHYEQASANSTSFTPVSTSFSGLGFSTYAAPAITDLDGDGLLDLLVGGYDGAIRHYEQVGTPTITSFDPTSGPVGTSVTITGTNLSGATAVTVNGTAGTLGTNTSTSLTFMVGAGSSTGAVSVVSPGGTATGGTFTVTPYGPVAQNVALPANSTYRIGQNLNFAVTFDQVVNVTGTPVLNMVVGSTLRAVSYVSGSGTATLLFRYTVVSPDLDANGVQVSSTIDLNGGTLRNATNTDAQLFLPGTTPPMTVGILVDGVAPTATVTTTAPNPTSSSVIPITITFSEPVTGLTVANIVVTNGTKGALSGSGTTFTLNVTPTSDGTVTVNVAANVAQDAAGNGNTAATQFSITYAPAPTITGYSASAELPGMPVVLTGTGFTAASTVTFGGVAAASVTYTSATSLTATVPAGAATGSSVIVVTTNSVSSTSSPAFTVLAVYNGGALDACTAAVPATATTGDGTWRYLLSSGGQVVLAYNYTGANLGTFSAEVLRANPASAVRQDARNHKYLDRNWHLTASGGTFTGRSVQLRFYGLTAEFTRLQTADAAVTYANLKATQYSGANEDCQLGNNAAAGQSRTLTATASTSGNGVTWFVSSVTVADHFSEFYLTGSATPLPVELTAFTAEAKGSTVQLQWNTASEKNSARFEVERSTDSQEFAHLGTVAAAGSSSSARTYGFVDAKRPASATLLYYRLRQVDTDGSFSYSPVRAVLLTAKADAGLALFPNPAPGGAATLTGAVPGTLVTVYDALGRPVTSAPADANGTAALVLPAGLATGVYVVRAGARAVRLSVE